MVKNETKGVSEHTTYIEDSVSGCCTTAAVENDSATSAGENSFRGGGRVC